MILGGILKKDRKVQICEFDNEPCIPDKDGIGRCGDDVKECPGIMEKRE